MDINHDLLKELFDLPLETRLAITPVTGGWNIRIKKSAKFSIPEKSFRVVMEQAGIDMNLCRKCGGKTYCHPHHIIPKSAGGKDDPDNGVPLCFNCHVGDNGVHIGKWTITSIVEEDLHFMLKKRYKLI